MKYTITKKEEREVKVAPETLLALDAFKKLKRAESRIEKYERELTGWLSEIPSEDMKVYVEITNEIEKEDN